MEQIGRQFGIRKMIEDNLCGGIVIGKKTRHVTRVILNNYPLKVC